MTFSFNYHVLENHIDGTKRSPSIPVILKGKNKCIHIAALVDSGADYTAMPKSVAEYLGLDMSARPETTGVVGSTIKSIMSTIKIQLPKEHNRRFFSIPVMIVLTKDEFPVLLGRAGFFERYKITIDERNEKIYLKPND